MAPAKPTLSILEWLGIGGTVLKTFSLAITALITIPFQRSKGPPTFGRHFAYAISHAYTGGISPRALVATSATTDEVYEKFTSLQKIKPESITLADGTRAHWLGGRSAEKILIAGDSAGGNLALALFSHLLHPHPDVEAIQISGQFAGVALLSPWVTFDTVTSHTMRTNLQRDVLGISALSKWSSIFQGAAASDPYLEPLSAPEDWWKGFPATKVQVLAGGDELFVSDIERFTEKLSTAVDGLTPTTVPKEAHDHLVIEFLFKEPRSKQRDEFERFIGEIVSA